MSTLELPRSSVEDRCRGVLLGLCAGDRIGGPLQMALQLLHSLNEQQGFVLQDVGQRYVDWWKQDGFDSGPTADRVFSLVGQGASFVEATQIVHRMSRGKTAGCNPMHRSVVLAMLSEISDDELHEYALQEAKLSHYDPLAGVVSSISVQLARLALKGVHWSEAIQRIREDCSSDLESIFIQAERGDIHRDGFAPHALSAALYFLHQNEDFQSMLSEAIHFAGPSNYCPVIAGALGGARWGAAAISPSWWNDVKGIEDIHKLAAVVSGRWQGTEDQPTMF